jgi:signal transduction histidine kinase/ligand-binding sensor domain-containing protein
LFRIGLLIAVCLAAGRASERYVFDTFGVDQGLRNLTVTAIRQDRQGFLWVGTQNGLYRFDGHRFLHYSTGDGLPADAITGLYESRDGTLWVGTERGLSWRTGVRFASSSNDALRPLSFTQGIADAASGGMYIATNSGLARASKDLKLEFLPNPTSIKSRRATSVWIEPGGAVWFGCGPSICRSEGGNTQIWGEKEGVPADGWQYLLKDAAGNLWARSRIYLIELPAGAREFHTVPAGQLHFAFPTLALDTKGTLLVPSDIGLLMIRDGRSRRIGQRQGLPGSIVTAAFQDTEGSLWVGTTAGLARWTGYGEWESFTEMEGLAGGSQLSLIEGASGDLWAGSGAGLSHGVFANGSWNWSAVPDESLAWVASMARAKDGAIWLATAEPALVRHDPRTGKSQRGWRFDGTPFFVFIDRADNMWVTRTNALYRGTARSPAAPFEQVRPPETTATTVFTRIVQDAHGDLWFGTFSGLYRLSAAGKWTHYRKENGLAGKQVVYLSASAAGDIYVTYHDDAAVDRVHPDGDAIHVSRVDRSHGLASEKVYSMRVDRQDRVWALTDRGAALFDGASWRRFDQSDGLLWNDCNTFLAAADGTIWIGTERGLTHFPSPRLRGPAAPRTTPAFSEARVGGRAVNPAAPLAAHRPERFTAMFSALDLARPSRVLYRYRIAGLDDRWVETARPEVSFDYLEAGSYRLEVQARREGSEWQGAPPLALEVLPRWFESLWFKLILASFICATAWTAWKARARRFALARARLQSEVDARTSELRVANEQLRGEIAERDRLEGELLQAKKLESIGRLAGGVAHDFNNMLTVISGHCELLLTRLHDADPLHKPILEIRAAGERAAALTSRLLAFSRKQMLRPKPVSLADTVRGMEGMLRRVVRHGIELSCDFDPDSGLVMADRAQIEQALINLVSNACDAIRGAGGIAIRVHPAQIAEGTPTSDPDLVPGLYETIAVTDTGNGMDEATMRNVFDPFFTTKDFGKGTGGLGLAMVHGVVKQSGGSILVESTPGKGTTFRIYLRRVSASPTGARGDSAGSKPPEARYTGAPPSHS